MTDLIKNGTPYTVHHPFMDADTIVGIVSRVTEFSWFEGWELTTNSNGTFGGLRMTTRFPQDVEFHPVTVKEKV